MRKDRGQNGGLSGHFAEAMYEVTRFVNQGAREIDPKQEIAQSRDFLAKSVWRRNIKSRNLPKNGWRRASLPNMDGDVHACTSRLLDLDPHYQHALTGRTR